MADTPLIQRARTHGSLMGTSRIDRILGSPWAMVATALILVVIFGWTFFTTPGRPAAADDPAYYHWRTEALLFNEPRTLLEATGPLDMYAGGYRVMTPVVAGMLRRVADVAPLSPTIFLAVGLRVGIPLLLAGLAFRWRRDPLIWHAVAFGSASLLLTPPFAGYLDNIMTLFLLAAAIYLIPATRDSWPARAGFFVLLFLSGMTHTTTLAIFCVVLGVMAAARLLFDGFRLRSVIREDGPMLATAAAAAVTTYLVWKVGIWGEPASLSEAALPPPASSDFFKVRLSDWVAAMRPPFNGPLFAVGVIGLLAAGRRWVDDDVSRTTLAWLAPLVGVFGFAAGVAYPYYRFFNTTLAWVLLVGVGAFLVARYFLDVARRGGLGAVALIGVLAVAFVIAGNFKGGLAHSSWNDVSDAWVKPDEKSDLEALHANLEHHPSDRPVVFVVDDETEEPVRIYGFAKRAGNVARYGVPGELQARTGYYLGSVERFVAGEATNRDPYYRDLSQASLDDVRAVTRGADPLVVVPAVFNRTGSNAASFEDGGRLQVSEGPEIVYLADGSVQGAGDETAVHPDRAERSGIVELLRTIAGIALLLLPGLLAARFFVGGGGAAEGLGMVPALSVGLLGVVTIGVLAVARSPLTAGTAWLSWGIALVLGAAALVWSAIRPLPRGSATFGAGGP